MPNLTILRILPYDTRGKVSHYQTSIPDGIRKKRSKIIRLQYNIPRSLPDGTEFRIALIVEGGNVKVRLNVDFHILLNQSLIEFRSI